MKDLVILVLNYCYIIKKNKKEPRFVHDESLQQKLKNKEYVISLNITRQTVAGFRLTVKSFFHFPPVV